MNGLLSVLSEFWVKRFGQYPWPWLVSLLAKAQSAMFLRRQLLAESYEAMLGDFIERRDSRSEQLMVCRWAALIDSLHLAGIVCSLVLLVCSFSDIQPSSSAPSSYCKPENLASADADLLSACAGEDD